MRGGKTKNPLHKQDLFLGGLFLFCFNLWTLFCLPQRLCLVADCADSTRRCNILQLSPSPSLPLTLGGHRRRRKWVVSLTSDSICVERLRPAA